MNARSRIYDVPAARRWAELRSGADDLRWATAEPRALVLAEEGLDQISGEAN